MSETHTITELIDRLRDEENHESAARGIWDRFIDKLISTARRKLKNLPRRATDEEDVAQLAFEAFFRGVKENRFRTLNDRNDLWQILVMLTERKAWELMRRELAPMRGAGQVRGESIFDNLLAESSQVGGLNNAGDPNDDWADYFTCQVRDLLDLLEPTMQQIALFRLEGKKNPAIADELGMTLRSVERKVRLIKDKWLAKLDRD